MQLVLDDVELHHGVRAEQRETESEARIIGASILAAEFLGHHLGPDALTAQRRQLGHLDVVSIVVPVAGRRRRCGFGFETAGVVCAASDRLRPSRTCGCGAGPSGLNVVITVAAAVVVFVAVVVVVFAIDVAVCGSGRHSVRKARSIVVAAVAESRTVFLQQLVDGARYSGGVTEALTSVTHGATVKTTATAKSCRNGRRRPGCTDKY